MNITIRLEQPADYREIENLTREAFWNHYSPGCCEHYLIHLMRDCPGFIPELDLVAEADGKIVGSAICMKGLVKRSDGTTVVVLSLGPLSVLPEYQRKGVGAKLIQRTREIAQELGYRAILLCGDPDYYTRQGFVPAQQYDIRTAENRYAAPLHVCELYDGALKYVQGCYFEDPVYQIDEVAAEEFDRQFPQKEKVTGTPTQEKFRKVAAMVSDPQ